MPFAVNRIDHVVLNCRDVDATTEWYVRVLGMRREVFGEGRVALVFGNQKINVRPTGAPNWETGAVDAPGCARPVLHRRPQPRRHRRALAACGVDDHRRPRPEDRGARPDDLPLLPGSRTAT